MINVPWIVLGVDTWALIVVDVCALWFVFGWFCERFWVVRWMSQCDLWCAMWSVQSIKKWQFKVYLLSGMPWYLSWESVRLKIWRPCVWFTVKADCTILFSVFCFHFYSGHLPHTCMNHYCIGTSHQTCSWWSETDTKEQGVIAMSCYTLQALNLIKVICHSTSHLDMQLNAKTKEKDSTLFFSKIEFCNDNNAASHDYDMHVSDLVWFSIDWLIRSCRTLQTNTFINKYLMETYHGLMILDIFVFRLKSSTTSCVQCKMINLIVILHV